MSAELLSLASARCRWQAFTTSARPSLLVKRVATPPVNGWPLEGTHSRSGTVALVGDSIFAHVPEETYPAEFALRVAYQICLERQGAVLVHSGGAAWGDQAVVAIGHSGAGKTTFSSLCVEGGGARLLSDEICAIFPDGQICGTPFRSNSTHTPTPGMARLKSLLVLSKDPAESLTPLSPAEVLPTLLGQVYKPFVQEPLKTQEAFSRLAAAAAKVGVQKFGFRKHPEAGRYIADWISR